jgi:hypothetical protein
MSKEVQIMSFGPPNEVIQQTWKMKEASATLEREKRCRLDIIREAAAGECVQGCEGMWL